MIRIDISKNKKSIAEKHYHDFTENKRVKNTVLSELKKLDMYSHVYNYLVCPKKINGEWQDDYVEDNFKALICAETKNDLLDQINIFEGLIKSDSNNARTVTKIREEIYMVFEKCYNNLSNRKWAYEFLEILNSDVCPYCNRTFTFSINKNGKKQKPEFDHYFPKRKYPYLGISIFNLVPICSNCNKGKGEKYVTGNKQVVLYPYEEDFETIQIKFSSDFDRIEAWFNNEEELRVKMQGNNKDIISSYNDAFKIEELYSLHKDYIIEILKKSIMLNDDFVFSIYSSFPELFSDINEVKELIYGNYLKHENFGRRPLSKMTHDLLEELQRILK